MRTTETNGNNTVVQQFSNTIDQWISWLDDYSFETLLQYPQPESWSLGQVYIHIISETTHFVKQVRECLLTDEHSGEEMHADAKAMFANNGFPDTLIEGPARFSDVVQPKNKEQLMQDLLRLKNEVQDLFFAAGTSRRSGKTRHPGLYFFNAQEWLRFAEMHMRHHFRQKQRIDEKLWEKFKT
jgi:uncharacterized damage-inducible protein DinB